MSEPAGSSPECASEAAPVPSRSFNGKGVRHVRALSCVQWTNPPPTILRTVFSTANVGALAHMGFAANRGPQEASVAELPNDLLIVFDRPPTINARIADTDLILEAGKHSALYLSAGSPSQWSCLRGSRSIVFHVYIPTQFRERVLSEKRRPRSTFTLLGPRDPAVQIAEYFKTALINGDSLSSMSIESYAALIVDGCAGAKIGSVSSSLTRWQLNRVIELMNTQLAEDISLEEIARAANLSLSHFARSFRKATGVSPHRYLVRLRLEKTKELLRATDLSIVDVAAEVGYQDPSYLARMFRRELGVTPASYRREHRSRDCRRRSAICERQGPLPL